MCFPEQSNLSEILSPSDANVAGVLHIILLGLFFSYWSAPHLSNLVIPGGWSIELEVIHYLLYLPLRGLGIRAILWSIAGIEALGVGAFWASAAFQGVAGSMAGTIDRLGLSESVLFFLVGILAKRLMEAAPRDSLNSSEAVAFSASVILISIHPGMLSEILPKFGFVASVFVAALVLVKIRLISSVSASIAKYSYFIYFFHFVTLRPLQDLFINLELPPVLALGLFSVCSFAISYSAGFLSYRLYEKPILRFVHSKTSSA